MREVAYFLNRLYRTTEPNGRTILENSRRTASTESGDGRHSDPESGLSGVFHAKTSADGRFKNREILDIRAEGLDVYCSMLETMGAKRRLGPADREPHRVDAILT